MKTARIALASLALGLPGWSVARGAEAWLATVANGASSFASRPCSVEGTSLHWQGPDGTELRLSEDFVTACDPLLDFAGENLYFSGRQTPQEPLRVWRLSLASKVTAPVTPDTHPARHPFLLADESIVFVSRGDLFRVRPEATEPEQLTFTRGLVQSAVALPDGRILFLAADSDAGRLFAMLPDGTWMTPWPAIEDLSVRDFTLVDSGRLLLLDDSGRLFLTGIADPFAGRTSLSFDTAASIRSLHRMGGRGAVLLADAGGKSGEMSPLVTAMTLDPEPQLREIRAFGDRRLLALEAAVPAPRVDPLPSIVKPETATGYLFVIDVARTDDPELEPLERAEIAEMRVLELGESGARTLLSTVVPAEDGSVYLEAPADTPLALELVDSRGDVMARTRTPIWVRPNERRGCLGCHVSPAYAPPNVLPRALLQGPHQVGVAAGEAP